MNITIFMVESYDGIIDTVKYFDASGKMKKADISVLKLDSNNIDFDRLAKIIEKIEYSNKLGEL